LDEEVEAAAAADVDLVVLLVVKFVDGIGFVLAPTVRSSSSSTFLRFKLFPTMFITASDAVAKADALSEAVVDVAADVVDDVAVVEFELLESSFKSGVIIFFLFLSL
jgi:hypothetical protein